MVHTLYFENHYPTNLTGELLINGEPAETNICPTIKIPNPYDKKHLMTIPRKTSKHPKVTLSIKKKSYSFSSSINI